MQFGSQIDTNRIPVKGLIPEESATAPTTPVDGLLWHDTTSGRVRVYLAGTWYYVDDRDTEHTANKGANNGYAGLDASGDVPLGNLPVAASGTSSSTQVVRADDSRLSNSRTPTGTAGGDLTGSYPNPTIAAGAVTDVEVAAANKDGLANVASMRTLGTGAQQAAAGNDARFTDSRTPTGAAGGDLAGTYPNPTIGLLKVTDAHVAAANKDGLAATPSMRTLGSGAQQACAGNDARLTNARTPTGSAGGDLTGTYPNPTIANLAVTDAKVAAANKDGTAAVPSMRTLGTGAQQALAGNTRLDQLAAPTTSVNLNSQKLINVATPTADTDGVNKAYADSLRAGLLLKDSVRLATTANITLSGTQTIDGIGAVANDRVLVKNQSTASANGIYVVAAGAWSRAADADSAGDIQDGTTVFVREGNTLANSTWAQINAIATIGTDAQSWVQQGQASTYVAGAGLTGGGGTGTTFDVVAADGSIQVNADSIEVGLVPVAKGGTGATTAVGARTNLGAVGKYAADLGALTAGSEATITHGLSSNDVVATFRDTNGNVVMIDWRVIGANSIGVTAGVAYSASSLRVVVVG